MLRSGITSIAAVVMAGVVVVASPVGTPRALAASQGGSCNAFSGAYALGASYTDSVTTVPACGPRPNYGGSQAHVYPYPGALWTPGYQCVEFSERFLYYRFGLTMGISTNGDQLVDHYATKYSGTFDAVTNGTAGRAPVQGDVLSFSKVSTFNDSGGGHTAVVQSSAIDGSGNGQLTLIEENASATGSEVVNVSNWTVTRSGYPYIKWLHSKSGGGNPSSNLASNGGFENGWGPWTTMAGTNYVDYRTGQVAGESARSGLHYGATNTSKSGGGIYEDVPVSASAGNVYCASAWVRTQYPATGASGQFVVWLLGGSYNENGVATFTGLSHGVHWRQVQTCVSASTAHTQMRIQFYPTVNGPTVDIDDVDVH